MDFAEILKEKLSKIKINLKENLINVAPTAASPVVEDLIPGGVSDGKSVEEIAKKHNVSVEDIQKEIELGIKTELEHTGDHQKAKEIATDHIFEHPKYYSDSTHGLNVNEPELDEAVDQNSVAQAKHNADIQKASADKAALEASKRQAALSAQQAAQKPMEESYSRLTPTKMDVLKEAWKKVKK